MKPSSSQICETLLAENEKDKASTIESFLLVANMLYSQSFFQRQDKNFDFYREPYSTYPKDKKIFLEQLHACWARNNNAACEVLHQINSQVLSQIYDQLDPKIKQQLLCNSPLLNILLDIDKFEFTDLDVDEFCQLVSNLNPLTHTELTLFQSYYRTRPLDFLIKLQQRMITDLELAKQIMPKLYYLFSANYSNNAEHQESSGLTTAHVMKQLPDSLFQLNDLKLRRALTAAIKTKPSIQNTTLTTLINGSDVKRAQGRTLVVKDADNKCLAIKLSKGPGDDAQLIKEFQTVQFLNHHQQELSLHNKLPNPVGLFFLTDLEMQLVALKNIPGFEVLSELISTNSAVDKLCYVYQAPEEYFTYAYEITDDAQFQQSINTGLVDLLCLQQKNGMLFHQLAPLFHGQDRRYRVLTDMLNNDANVLPQSHILTGMGMGRLDSIDDAVRFINLRAFPYAIADIGDHIVEKNYQFVNRTVSNKTKTIRFFNDTQEDLRTLNPWHLKETQVITVNYFAEYLFVIFLAIARRTISQQKSWENAIDSLLEVASAGLAFIKQETNSQMQFNDFLRASINPGRLAMQCRFFMTQEQVKYIEQGVIPDEIYGFTVKPRAWWTDKKEDDYLSYLKWKRGFGPESKPNRGLDLGPWGGNNPLSELSKLLNIFASTLSIEYYQAGLKTTMVEATTLTVIQDRILRFFKQKNHVLYDESKRASYLDLPLFELKMAKKEFQHIESQLDDEMKPLFEQEKETVVRYVIKERDILKDRHAMSVLIVLDNDSLGKKIPKDLLVMECIMITVDSLDPVSAYITVTPTGEINFIKSVYLFKLNDDVLPTTTVNILSIGLEIEKLKSILNLSIKTAETRPELLNTVEPTMQLSR